MKFITYLLSFITPQTIEHVPSKINGFIDVEISFGSYRLSVDRYWQSGKYPALILGKALRLALNKSINIKNILVLGLGGGSVIDEINRLYPKAKITGVDLDPIMITLGRKYLNLNKAKNLIIIIDNASNFVAKRKSKEKFDMIVSDLFIGCNVPESTTTDKYLDEIYKLLSPGGVYICNLPYRDGYKKGSDDFITMLKKHIPDVETKNIAPHLIIWAYKQ